MIRDAWDSMMDWFSDHDIIACVLVMVFAGILLVGGGCITYYFAEGHSCRAKAELYQRETHFDFFTGCFIRLDDGTYIEIDKYRNQVELEGAR